MLGPSHSGGSRGEGCRVYASAAAAGAASQRTAPLPERFAVFSQRHEKRGEGEGGGPGWRVQTVIAASGKIKTAPWEGGELFDRAEDSPYMP